MNGIYAKGIKRILDLVLSLIITIVLSPVMLILVILVKIGSPGPAFFKQKRICRNKKEFYIYKFRTMLTDTPKDKPTDELEDPEKYITKIGGFLRKTSLDELPQLINIIKGEMAIIGPRPALWNQFDLIALRDKNGANELRPGLTGWAQINGRDELSLYEKVYFDGEYVKKISFWMDVRCFFMTIFKVLRSEGIREGKVPTEEIEKLKKPAAAAEMKEKEKVGSPE